MSRACTLCGTQATEVEGDQLPPGWSLVTNERGVQWLCLDCTRANVRSIEAKLPEEWW